MRDFTVSIKKIPIILLIFCIVSLIFPLYNVLASAETVTEASGLNEALQEALDNLNLQELEEYFSKTNFSQVGLKERLLEYIKGGTADYDSIFKQISNIFFNEVIELLPIFSTVTAIALLCGILSTIQAGALHKQLETVLETVAFAACLIPIFQIFSKCFLTADSCAEEMRTQMEILFPILLTLLAASGGSVSVAICKPSVAFLSTTMVALISQIVFPITLLIFSFSIANRTSSDFKLGKFIAVFKSINKWLIGIGVSVFGLFFTVQGITAGAYDGIARRAAKYAIGNGVPIIGGFLSGGFDLAIAGSILIKNSLGYLGILLMISSILEPIILLLATNLLLKFCGAITSPFSDNKISDFLVDTADSLNYLSAGILFTAFLYFLCIVIFISTMGAFF